MENNLTKLKTVSSKPLTNDSIHLPKWLIKDNNCIQNVNGKSYLIVKGNK